jgi:nucleotidyltransferase substrate binding protein (TIGR01987 family)
MMKPEQKDIRWEQRFSNYRKALAKFRSAVRIIRDFDEDEREASNQDEELLNGVEQLQKEGLIQRFEYTHELAWNVMKDYSEYQGNTNVKGSRDATREAFKMQLITDGETWMDMIETRNDTSHTYNEEITEEIFLKIVNSYFPLFTAFENKMEDYRSGKMDDIFD